MLYKFTIDGHAHEAEVAVTRAARADWAGPPDGYEIEIVNVWLIGPRGRRELDKRFSTRYNSIEAYLVGNYADILKQHDDEVVGAEINAAEDRADQRQEG